MSQKPTKTAQDTRPHTQGRRSVWKSGTSVSCWRTQICRVAYIFAFSADYGPGKRCDLPNGVRSKDI